MAAEYGDYFLREDIERDHPEIIAEWDAWLQANTDPGHYDAYKDRTKHPPEWKCDIYMPAHLMRKVGLIARVGLKEN